MSLAELVRERSLLVCVGPGGVGKTTLGASLALAAATQGRRVAVITIDPARRLADALGLDGLDDALRPVPGVGPGSLDAAMLDTKASYDALIDRITDDPRARRRILDNRVYQSFSRTLARSHAYVAMERLHDVLQEGAHDLVVLDTPPTRSALDILDAPGRLVRFLDERVLAAFIGEPAGGAGAWIRAKGAEVALRLFGAMVGDALMRELAGFFEVFFHLRRGFAERASTVVAHLSASETGFVLVTAPQATHLADAAYLRDGLLARGAPLEAVLFNRAFHPDAEGRPIGPGPAWSPEAEVDALDLPDGERASARRVLSAARALRGELAVANRAFDDAMRRFAAAAGPRVHARLRLPILDEEPATLDALTSLLERASAL
ncbi:MAG TPA: ArsA-related P-loop ATPase [Sandaracinaceae bacterium LLY-WYZ-13_1]|nr:ArsA-related P-loop ATPase [Sandaracinaceae bacterium LLY-WYZ-13_1]